MFSRVVTPFYIPTSNTRDPVSPCPRQHLVASASLLFVLVILRGVQGYSTVVRSLCSCWDHGKDTRTTRAFAATAWLNFIFLD